MANYDQRLHKETLKIYEEMSSQGGVLKTNKDYRWFFTNSHAYITRQIHRHINLFKKPNDLMRLNSLFARDFLRSFKTPHGRWKDAYEVCAGYKDAREAGFLSMLRYDSFSYEGCAACMAQVHITQDLRKALQQERGVSEVDYGNVLVFVNEGHFYSTKLLFGTGPAALRITGQLPIINFLGTTAERWRNEAWRSVMKTNVPKPTKDFTTRYYKAENRPGY
ncbi:MAG: hypothetical protein QNJ15_01015 [Erythrobacter sp.]|nr:hypothetical protein [Erythrobacter sp.]